MKRFIKVTSYDNNITTRAMLIGAYGSLTLPKGCEEAAERGDLSWAIEWAVFNSERPRKVSDGFKTLRDANAVATNLRRCIDIGQGMMKGAGLIEGRVFYDVSVVKG